VASFLSDFRTTKDNGIGFLLLHKKQKSRVMTGSAL